MKINIRKEIAKLSDEIYNYRRQFHKYPELSFKEFKTSETISKYLKEFGIKHKKNVGKTGVVGEIYFGPGPTIALRADMDALPMQEKGNLEYKSRNDGVMHACGHDGHMAILLGAAKALSENSTIKKGTVKFIFQPAEEGGGGARYMIKDGCLNGVDEIYGLHLWNYQKYGEVGLKTGPVMASADMFDIEIQGKGGHGAAPQGTVDAIVVASHLITILQTIVSRNTNPLENTVLTIGKIKGGENFNVISDNVYLSGTTRAYSEKNRQMIKKRMEEIIEGVSKSFNAIIKINYKEGYPPTVNHDLPVKNVLRAAQNIVGDQAKSPYLSMGGEDFSYYLQKIPGCFFFIGSSPEKNDILSTPHHCSHFNIDERSLLIGASVYLNLIENSFK
jgi:amidohydrolase|tara:strand:- start:2138 stop:3304 length:1167 start_codon:yes stop_codon:yes gene_type:complete